MSEVSSPTNRAQDVRQARIATLEAEIQAIRAEKPERKTWRKKAAVKKEGRQGISRLRSHTQMLAPGHPTTTLRGSLYNTILRSMALVGKLDLHTHYFSEFRKAQDLEAARTLLTRIGVYRAELEKLVFADVQFKEHQQRRTAHLKNRIARGDEHAREILDDPLIGDGKGNWRGDLDEALNILYGARLPKLANRLRNVRHLKQAKLLFDHADRDGQQVLFMYPRKFYRDFRYARTLAGE